MPYLFAFRTTKFDVSKESPNPISPIAGESVLIWLRSVLAEAQYQVTQAAPEDFGWYVEVHGADASYMVVASGDAQVTDSESAWIVQICKNRSLSEKLLGRGKLSADDPLVGVVERTLRGANDIRNIEVSSNV
jgi:hypothetical protein